MLGFVHFVFHSCAAYPADAILFIFIGFFACFFASKDAFKPSGLSGLARAGRTFNEKANTRFARTRKLPESSTPPSPEPESEPADNSIAKTDWPRGECCLSLPTPALIIDPEPEELPTRPVPMKSEVSNFRAHFGKPPGSASPQENHRNNDFQELLRRSGLHREMSPPKVLRWSYDALAEDEKKKQGTGTFSPLADALRADIKLPPGLDHTTIQGWKDISYGFASLQSGMSVIRNSMDKPNVVACSGSLREDMELLKRRDPECVLVVKKIKKLGFDSPAVLKKYFSQYGVVLDVMVALTHSPRKTKSPRVRPATMGFVVMGSALDAKNVLQAGISQEVEGVVIELRGFSSFDDHYGAHEEVE